MRGDLVREGLTEKVTFEPKRRRGRAKTADFCEKSTPRQREQQKPRP